MDLKLQPRPHNPKVPKPWSPKALKNLDLYKPLPLQPYGPTGALDPRR